MREETKGKVQDVFKQAAEEFCAHEGLLGYAILFFAQDGTTVLVGGRRELTPEMVANRLEDQAEVIRRVKAIKPEPLQ